jgi:hypothetical protein
MGTKIMITTLLAATIMFSCNPKEILEPTLDYPAFVVIDGDTVKTRDDKGIKDKISKYDRIGLLETTVVGDTTLVFKMPKRLKPTKIPDVAKYKNLNIPELKGKPFKLVAAGGNLTQGMRDGGIFNEGMLTSYPTLIANQIGVDFQNALFDPSEYNGLGRKVFTSFNPTAGPVPKQKEVSNNLAIENGKVKRYKGSTDNNYISNVGVYSGSNANSQRLIGSLSNTDGTGILESFFSTVSQGKKKFDFIIFESGLQDVLPGRGFIQGEVKYDLTELQKIKVNSKVEFSYPLMGVGGSEVYTTLFKFLVSQELNRGVILNCPDLEDLPYYSKSYAGEIKQLYDTYKLGFNNLTNSENLVLGASSIDSLLSPRVNINIKPWVSTKVKYNNEQGDNYIISSEVRKGILEKTLTKNSNSKILSQYANMPICDINALYKNILKGTVVTSDGVKVDATWPGGNFFSNDGVYPSAFGQAVIANEVIKIMNSFYKMEIELIPTAEYLNR